MLWGFAWDGGTGGGFFSLTERARLARAAATAATKADTTSATKDTAAGCGSRGRRSRAVLDARITNVTRARTPVGRNDSGAQTTSHAGARTKRREAGTAGSEADGAIVDRQRTLLVEGLLLPPRGVSVEQAQLLLGLSVVRHLVLVLAALLGKGASSVMDPLVTVDLFTAGTAAAGAATAVVLEGASRGVAVETTGGKNERVAAAGSGRRVDNGVDPRLSHEVITCQPSERSCAARTVGIMGFGDGRSQGHVLGSDESGLLASCLPGCCRSRRRWGWKVAVMRILGLVQVFPQRSIFRNIM